ncbi:glycosyltransferase family 4 protein [Singulisphaera sp. GP187]|uniref:glycosyltransferase family 4 protein n=1 Tax=Singulisphaera sp. GP187 TaxID=1882752 RepID=UPI00116148D0|nr:glycosyltransferase family 4 protein [Singulisphaera sp. GP187]
MSPATASVQRKPNVLFIGEKPLPDSPTARLASILRTQGFQTNLETNSCSLLTWIKYVNAADAMILITYRCFGFRRMAKILFGVLVGVPLIRRWAGTDVMNCLENSSDRWFARSLNCLVTLNIAAAPHLCEELASIGINSVFLPSSPDLSKILPTSCPRLAGRDILVYMPVHKASLFNELMLNHVFRVNRDIGFIVVGCEDGLRFSEHDNVRVFGWIDDMKEIYPQVGCLLRVSLHDGLPRMVLESLLQCKYVIYSKPMPGCWLAGTFEEIQSCIELYRSVEIINREGIDAVKRILGDGLEERLAETIRQVIQAKTLKVHKQ